MSSPDHFFITCPSNSSLELYPDNKVAHFKMRLNQPCELIGNYEVGLSQIQYPMSWNNIRRNRNGFSIRYERKPLTLDAVGKSTKRLYRIAPGYYSDISKVVHEMKTLLTQPKLNKLGIDIQYNDATRRVTINTKQSERHGEKLKSIKLKNDVAMLLGFKNDRLIKPNREVTSTFLALPSSGFHHMYVYCDVVQETAVGDVQAPLLRVLPAKMQSNELMIDTAFANVHYIPVARKQFSELEFKITDDVGNLVGFQQGKIVIVLHFRRKNV